MMNVGKVIYLRVSTEELDESTQLPEITKGFNLKESECIVLRERISAYKEEAQKDRTEFIKLKDMIEKGEVSDIYVYSLERLERNIIRLFEFFFYAEAHNCRVHGLLQPSLDLPFEDNPIGTFSRYQQVLMFGLLGENESYMTSKRTRKAVVTKEGKLTKSYKGNKWGSSLTYESGKRVPLKIQQEIYTNIQKSILRYEKINFKGYFRHIISSIKNSYDVKISKGYISKIKKGIKQWQ